jgi:radical SAM protein with 4Fe4S-binding SPASM domain
MRRTLTRKVREAIRALATGEIRFEYEHIPIRIRKAPLRKVLNWILVELALVLKRKDPWGCPTFLQIEPTTECNLKCGFCPVSRRTDEPSGHMDREMFERFLDEVGEYALLLVLWGWGEPFVCPDVYDMIAYAKSKGLSVISSTNGRTFADLAQARRLVRSGIDTLIVSTIGITQESHARFRQGQVDTTLQAVRNIVEAKRAFNSNSPFISLTLMVTQCNEHEVGLTREVAESLGVNMLSLKKVNPCTKDLHGQRDHLLPKDEKYSRFQYHDHSGEPVRVQNNPCKALWHKTNLRWDGRVNACTFDFGSVSRLGDFRLETFRRIWWGSAYRSMRRQFREDWRRISICSKCTYAFTGGNYTDIIAESFPFDYSGGDQTRRRPHPRQGV